MLRACIRKELLHHLVSYRYLTTSVLLVTLAVLSALVSTLHYNQRSDVYASQLWAQQEELRQARVYSYLQPMALRPPEPLSIFVRGLDEQLGNAVRIHLFTIPQVATGVDRGNPFWTTFRSFDLTTLVQVLVGLQALLLTFDGIVGEREQRNLQLVLAQGVCRRTFYFGKFWGAFAVLGIPLALSLLLSLAVVKARSEIVLDSHTSLRLVGLVGAYAVYLALMLLLGLFVSLVSRRASRALALAVLAWLVLVFVLPQMSLAANEQILRGRHDQAAAERAVSQLLAERDRRWSELWRQDPLRTRASGHLAPVVQTDFNQAVLRLYGSAAYYDALVGYYRQEIALGMRYAEQVFALQHAQQLELQRAEQRVVAMSFLSPAVLLGRVAESLAGTSRAEHEVFLAACRSYRQEFIAFLEQQDALGSWRWFTTDLPPGQPWPTLFGFAPEQIDEHNFAEVFARFLAPDFQQKLQADLVALSQDPERRLPLDELPGFRFVSSTLGEALRRVVPELGILFGTIGVLGLLGLRRFLADLTVGAPWNG